MSLSHAELLALLDYDPATGAFTRRSTGKQIGCKTRNGYLQIRINGTTYYAHRLAWLYVHQAWPKFIDHINAVRDDNRIANLRSVTRTQNNRHSPQKSTNKSGYKGVSYSKVMSKWVATITVDRQAMNLGYYDDPRDAAYAYDAASTQYHGAFAKNNKSMGLLP